MHIKDIVSILAVLRSLKQKTMENIGLALLTITLAFTTVDKKTIVIDVGHGGHDNITTSNGFSEK